MQTQQQPHGNGKALRTRWWPRSALLACVLLGSTSPGAVLAQDKLLPAVPNGFPEPPIQLPQVVPDGNPVVPVAPQLVPSPAANGPKIGAFSPTPQAVDQFGHKQYVPSTLADMPRVIGNTPKPGPETVKRYDNFVKEMIDPEVTLDLISGRTRLMVFKQVPKRIQVADETTAGYTVLTPKEISLMGRHIGVTVLTLWFADPVDPAKQNILTYYVRVVPDPEMKERLERVYKTLAEDINRAFPDSVVHLQLVGDKLVVSGHAKDVADAAHIMRIVRANGPLANQFNRAREAARIPVDHQYPEASTKGAPPPPPGLENYEVGENNPFIINLLRIEGEQQVQLKVTVAEVNRSAARSIGLNFALFNKAGQSIVANTTGDIVSNGLSPIGGLGSGFLNTGVNTFGGLVSQGASNIPVALDNGRMLLAISALRNLNYARSLAEPNIVAMNGQTAQFQAGGEFPVPVISTGYTSFGLQGVNFVPYGVQLSFTPFILDRDKVRLQVGAVVSARDLTAGTTYIGGAAVPSLTTRNFSTTVELREGQTLAVAGLIQNNLGADSSRIPFLGDLPIIGRAFGFDSLTAGDQELVVLITPELVHPMNRKEVPQLPGADLFEPTDLEFYILGRIESHYGTDFRSPYRTDWQRLHNYRRMERMYIVGPSGPGDEQ